MPSVCCYFQVHQPGRLKRYSVFDIGHVHDYEDDPENRRILDQIGRASCRVKVLISVVGG